MQVKKFEAPTLQEALETVKRELGPEAIILQTRKNKSGFGLMSKASVEVTAAISDRSLNNRALTERRLPKEVAERVKRLPAEHQARFIEQAVENAQGERAGKSAPKLTATRYADIDDVSSQRAESEPSNPYVGGSAGTYNARIAHSQLAAKAAHSAPPAPPVLSNALPPIVSSPAASETHSVPAPNERALLGEIQRLEKMIQELRQSQPKEGHAPSLPQGIEEAMELLLLAGVDRRRTYALMKQAAFELGEVIEPTRDQALDEVAKILMEQIETLDALEGIAPREERSADSAAVLMALAGTSGSGKTSMIAKIARLAHEKQGLRVGLISLELEGDQGGLPGSALETFAKLSKTPYRRVKGKDELSVAAHEMRSLDLVLIDAPSVSQKDDRALTQLSDSLKQFPSLRVQLVLQAGTRDPELNDVAHRFGETLKPEGLIFTKLDEAVAFGSIFNVSRRFKLPLMYFSTGQKVPEDIESATKERLVALLLDLL